MHRISADIRGKMIPEMRINGARVYLDPIKDPDLNPDTIDERERVQLPRRRSVTRWSPHRFA